MTKKVDHKLGTLKVRKDTPIKVTQNRWRLDKTVRPTTMVTLKDSRRQVSPD